MDLYFPVHEIVDTTMVLSIIGGILRVGTYTNKIDSHQESIKKLEKKSDAIEQKINDIATDVSYMAGRMKSHTSGETKTRRDD